MARTDYDLSAERKAELLAAVKPLIVKHARRVGVPASIMAAQWCIESFYGLGDELPPEHHNLFGQKVVDAARDPYATGKFQAWTTEYDEVNAPHKVLAEFWAYPSPEASIASHCDYVTGRLPGYGSSLYAAPWPVSPEGFARWLVTAPREYATDDHYPQMLIAKVDEHDLWTWDQTPTATPPTIPAVPIREDPMSIRDTIAQVIDAAAAANIGYDQSQRRSWYTDATGITKGASEADCSALSAGCWRLAGIPIRPDAWTGSLVDDARAVGAQITDIAGWTLDQIKARMQPGDMILGPGHVVIVTRDGQVLSAEGDERGRAKGGQAGDQTGREVLVKPLYSRPKGWTHLIVPPGVTLGVASPSANQAWTHRVTAKGLNVRSSAPTATGLGAVLTTVARGARLRLINPEGGVRASDGAWWHEVAFQGGSRGWVNVAYIDRIDR